MFTAVHVGEMAFILGTFLLYNTVKTYDTAAAKATERY
jgi:hypothetical protein